MASLAVHPIDSALSQPCRRCGAAAFVSCACYASEPTREQVACPHPVLAAAGGCELCELDRPQTAAELRLARRLALARWDRAVISLRLAKPDPGLYWGARTHAFFFGCDWQSAAHEAGLGRVDRPAATAYPVEREAT